MVKEKPESKSTRSPENWKTHTETDENSIYLQCDTTGPPVGHGDLSKSLMSYIDKYFEFKK